MSDIRIVEASAAEVLSKGGGLLQEQWDEIALNKRVMVLKPDAERYRQIEAVGMLVTLAAYAGDELVGYSVSFLSTHLHYADLTVCNNDVLFVRKEHRRGRVGLQLIRETERIAKLRGAQLMLWHAKEGTALEALMPRLGYGVQDVIFSKEV